MFFDSLWVSKGLQMCWSVGGCDSFDAKVVEMLLRYVIPGTSGICIETLTLIESRISSTWYSEYAFEYFGGAAVQPKNW